MSTTMTTTRRRCDEMTMGEAHSLLGLALMSEAELRLMSDVDEYVSHHRPAVRAECREWIMSLPVERRKKHLQRARAQRKREAKRTKIVIAACDCMNLREQLARTDLRPEQRREYELRLRNASFVFEKEMIQRRGLDHLAGVEVYGIKRREIKFLSAGGAQ